MQSEGRPIGLQLAANGAPAIDADLPFAAWHAQIAIYADLLTVNANQFEKVQPKPLSRTNYPRLRNAQARLANQYAGLWSQWQGPYHSPNSAELVSILAIYDRTHDVQAKIEEGHVTDEYPELSMQDLYKIILRLQQDGLNLSFDFIDFIVFQPYKYDTFDVSIEHRHLASYLSPISRGDVVADQTYIDTLAAIRETVRGKLLNVDETMPVTSTPFDTFLQTLCGALDIKYVPPAVDPFASFADLHGRIDGAVFSCASIAYQRLGADAPPMNSICTNPRHEMYPFLLQLAISEAILTNLRTATNFKRGQVSNSGVYSRMNVEITIIASTQRRARQLLAQGRLWPR